MKILVLQGGDSPEREVSLRSAASVAKALQNLGIEYSIYDPAEGFEGLKKACLGVDGVLPILHGVNCEDGFIQKQLEDIGVPYLGSNSSASKICFDKNETHKVLESAGIRMPKYAVVAENDLLSNDLSSKPFVLKPLEGGSSVDTLVSRAADKADLDAASKLLNRYEEMMLEELIEGQEITVPVLGANALPPIAIVPPENGEFDYENKYNGSTQEICPIPSDLVSQSIQKEAQEMALKVHSILEARHLSRTDMFVTSKGQLIVLELNTIPGLTDASLFPNSAKVAGYSMDQLVRKFIEMVVSSKVAGEKSKN